MIMHTGDELVATQWDTAELGYLGMASSILLGGNRFHSTRPPQVGSGESYSLGNVLLAAILGQNRMPGMNACVKCQQAPV